MKERAVGHERAGLTSGFCGSSFGNLRFDWVTGFHPPEARDDQTMNPQELRAWLVMVFPSFQKEWDEEEDSCLTTVSFERSRDTND